MKLFVIPGGAFVENTYILSNEGSSEVLLVDPGSQTEEIEKQLNDLEFSSIKIINTHAHLDHIYGVEYFKKKYDALFLIHELEVPIVNVMIDAAMRFGLEEFSKPEIPKIDEFIKDNQEIEVAGSKFITIHVPGHSPGSLCFYFSKKLNPNIENEFVICGDTVFAGSIGRVDLTGGTNMNDLVGNIKKRLMVLPDETVLLPGHGPETRVGVEKQSNPFLLGYE